MDLINTLEQEVTAKAGKKCPRCGGEAKVGLDFHSENAKALDGALANVLTIKKD